MAYDALLRVVEEEAAREVERIRASAGRERERILEEARVAVAAVRDAVVARERAADEARRRAAREARALARERMLLVERGRALEALHQEAQARLVPAPGTVDAALDARLLSELAPELPEGPLLVEVDPGAVAAAREALARIAPGAAERATFRAAESARGGVLVEAGRLVLDDTLPARLERAWPALEPELVKLLLGEDG